MNALKTALVSLLTGDSTLASLAGTTVRVYDKIAPQTTSAVYPYILMNVSGDTTDYHMAGRSAKTFNVTLKAVDSGDSSKRAGQLDERIEDLLHPNEPLVVPGWRTGFKGRSTRVDYSEISSGVKYNHVGGVYRITLIPI